MHILLEIGQLVLWFLLFLMLTAPVLVFPVFVGMNIYLGKSRNRPGFYGLAVTFVILTLLFIMLNPITGTLLGSVFEHRELNRQNSILLGERPEDVVDSLGEPDSTLTNNEAIFFIYRNTSPWFSWIKSDTVVKVQSNKVIWITLDD